MTKYEVTAYAMLEMVTYIEANSEEEAKQIAQDRIESDDFSICIHGSAFIEGIDENVFTLKDGVPEKIEIYEVEEN